jgi:hypothetical protein
MPYVGENRVLDPLAATYRTVTLPYYEDEDLAQFFYAYLITLGLNFCIKNNGLVYGTISCTISWYSSRCLSMPCSLLVIVTVPQVYCRSSRNVFV